MYANIPLFAAISHTFCSITFHQGAVILLPAVIFVSLPLVWFPGIIIIAKDEVATYTFITKEAITIAEPISAYLRLYFKAIQPTVCIKYFLSTIASHYTSCDSAKAVSISYRG